MPPTAQPSIEKIRGDFDRIAQLDIAPAHHHELYESFLIEQIPPSAKRVLDVGCGTGSLSQLIAGRGAHVLGIDLAPEMIRIARGRAPRDLSLSYLCGDFFDLALAPGAFDCVVSVAALHHMPLDAAVLRMADLVAPGGVLIIHDLRSDEGVRDRLWTLVAAGARTLDQLRPGSRRPSAEEREAWREHGRGERYLTISEARAYAGRLLPGAQVFWHLRWRYTVTWRRLLP